MRTSANRDLYVWIYQRTQAKVPWAIRVHGYRRGRTIGYDAEIYAEWIPSKSQRATLRACNFHLFPLPRDADVPMRACVLTGLPGIVSDLCELYGGEYAYTDLAMIRQKMQRLYQKLK